MSIIPGVSSISASSNTSTGDFFDNAISALIKPARQFNTLVAQITISEAHSDDCDITSHPVQDTANISDHIIIMPAQLTIRMGWTNYGLQSVGTYVNEAIAGSPIPTPASISSIYKQLLAMKAARIPFKVVTGKRVYPTMVIRNLTTETDENTANNLIVTVRAQEIFLVQTQIVAAPPNNAQANPAASGSPVSNGLKLLQNAPANISGIFSSAS